MSNTNRSNSARARNISNSLINRSPETTLHNRRTKKKNELANFREKVYNQTIHLQGGDEDISSFAENQAGCHPSKITDGAQGRISSRRRI